MRIPDACRGGVARGCRLRRLRRVKQPVGARLAQGLHATAYNGSMPASGPVLAGCQVSADRRSLLLKFDAAGLKGEAVVFNRSSTVDKEDTALCEPETPAFFTAPGCRQKAAG